MEDSTGDTGDDAGGALEDGTGGTGDEAGGVFDDGTGGTGEAPEEPAGEKEGG